MLLFCLVSQAIAFFDFLSGAAAPYTSYYLRYILIRQKQNFLSANWVAPADSVPNVDSSVVPLSG